MRAACWISSLSLLAISVVPPGMAEPSLRQKALEEMRASRPADLVVLETRELGRPSMRGIFAIEVDSALDLMLFPGPTPTDVTRRFSERVGRTID